MSIDFTPERWEKVKENYNSWWENKLERPIIPVIVEGRDPGRPEPKTHLLTQANCHDLTISPEDIIDRIDYELSKQYYMGDAFPYFNMDCFGPGVAAAFLGARLDNSTGRVWFHPVEDLPITELHFEYDPDNIWLKRVKDIYTAGMKRWQGQVLMGMVDLGGVMDILSTFRPGEQLLYDLYDYPEEVNRLIWELYELWHCFYNDINEVLQPVNPGYSDWSQIYSDKPSYVIQSDFSYMIGPDMFEEFVRPELEATCKRLPHTMYHLDGVGEIKHLDSLLQIKELDAVQWVPGDGKPDQSNWPEIYQKIHGSGKKIQIWNGIDCLRKVSQQIGTSKGIHHTAMRIPLSEEKNMKKILADYGIK
jgi:hypothetical protein